MSNEAGLNDAASNFFGQMRCHVDEGGNLSHKNALDLLAEVERLLSCPWKLIETAPRDGTHILVGTFPESPGHMTRTSAHWFDGAWALSVNYDGEHSDHGVRDPTHWSPLPNSAAVR